MSRLIRPLLAAALTAVAFSPSTPARAAGDVEVALAGGQFVPLVAQVPAGSSLTFVNRDVTNYPMVILANPNEKRDLPTSMHGTHALKPAAAGTRVRNPDLPAGAAPPAPGVPQIQRTPQDPRDDVHGGHTH